MPADAAYFARRIDEAERLLAEAEAKVAEAKARLEAARASEIAQAMILDLMRRNLAALEEAA